MRACRPESGGRRGRRIPPGIEGSRRPRPPGRRGRPESRRHAAAVRPLPAGHAGTLRTTASCRCRPSAFRRAGRAPAPHSLRHPGAACPCRIRGAVTLDPPARPPRSAASGHRFAAGSVRFMKLGLAFSPGLCYNTTCARQKACADVAQSVERILGKDEVTSSNLVISSMKTCRNAGFFVRFGGENAGFLMSSCSLLTPVSQMRSFSHKPRHTLSSPARMNTGPARFFASHF